MTQKYAACAAVVLALLSCQGAATANAAEAKGNTSVGHITGVGGIFFKSKDPKKLAAWYRDVLGLQVEDWGGAMLRYDAPKHPEQIVWTPFAEKTEYMAPSTREFMINFAVDDLDAVVAKLKLKGVAILKREEDPNGKFAWFLDPDGTKIELWEPKGQ